MPLLEVYEGDRPYIFVNYAHADDRVVLPIIGALVARGYRVWYDDGIQPAHEFPDYIADHIHDCARFVMFVSRASLDSPWCKREVGYALSCRKPILPVYLEEVELTRGLELMLGTVQALFWHSYANDAAFNKELFAVRALDCCLTSAGKSRGGVQPRVPESQTVLHPAGIGSYGSGVALGFVPKGGFDAYSWAEIKELSLAIAAADEGGWPAIVKEYNLVGEDGRLRGDTKAITLRDGRKTTARIRILGFRHDELAGGGRAGISFEFADVPATHCMNPTDTNEGGWGASDMRGWLNDGRAGFLSLLPDDLRPHVAPAAKRTNNRGRVMRENDTSPVTATTDALWLLSVSEVYGRLSEQRKKVPRSPATYDAEGAQYELYADKGVTTSSYGPCKKDGADSWWWLRSPDASDTFGFLYVHRNGDWSYDYAGSGWGVSPGFCI